jgi:hypothetical protein
MSFKNIIISFFTITTLICLALIVLQSNKPISLKTPYMYYLTTDSNQIFRTNNAGESKDLVYQSEKIRNFGVNYDTLMLIKGEDNKASKISYLRLNKDSDVNEIEFENKYIDEVYSIKDKFLILFEEMNGELRSYRGQLAIIDLNTKKIEYPNPNFYVTDVSQVHVNQQGSFVVFNGFNGYKFVMDLNNFENIKKLEDNYSYLGGFIDETNLIGANYQTKKVNTYDIVNNSKKEYDLEAANFQEIRGGNNEIYYTITKSDNTDNKKYLRKINGLISSNTDFSYEDMITEKTDKYMILGAYDHQDLKNRLDLIKSRNVFQKIFILDIQKSVIKDTQIRAKVFKWGL